jgi:hypothetical protein
VSASASHPHNLSNDRSAAAPPADRRDASDPAPPAPLPLAKHHSASPPPRKSPPRTQARAHRASFATQQHVLLSSRPTLTFPAFRLASSSIVYLKRCPHRNYRCSHPRKGHRGAARLECGCLPPALATPTPGSRPSRSPRRLERHDHFPSPVASHGQIRRPHHRLQRRPSTGPRRPRQLLVERAWCPRKSRFRRSLVRQSRARRTSRTPGISRLHV